MTFENNSGVENKLSSERHLSAIREKILEDGYAIVNDVLSSEFIRRCKSELAQAIDYEKDKYGAVAARDYAMVLLCSLYGGTFNEVFDNPKLMQPFESMLGENCIVYAYTSSSMPPRGKNYSTRIHVDCPRLIPNYLTNMGATIALDDFTVENGATYFLPRSQTMPSAPNEAEFYEKAKRFTAPAGSVLFFNARLWHAGGINASKDWRHALTLNMCRPYMKQRIDIPRAMAEKPNDLLSEKAKQKLGFYCQPPASLEEYYLPPEKRSFRQPAE